MRERAAHLFRVEYKHFEPTATGAFERVDVSRVCNGRDDDKPPPFEVEGDLPPMRRLCTEDDDGLFPDFSGDAVLSGQEAVGAVFRVGEDGEGDEEVREGFEGARGGVRGPVVRGASGQADCDGSVDPGVLSRVGREPREVCAQVTEEGG